MTFIFVNNYKGKKGASQATKVRRKGFIYNCDVMCYGTRHQLPCDLFWRKFGFSGQAFYEPCGAIFLKK